MMEMPSGVNHAANTFKIENWINPLNGYAYDSFNKEVLLTAKAENGKMLLESGAAYRALIFPGLDKYSKETHDKILELKNGGVVIPDLPFAKENFDQFNIEKDVIAPENVAWTHRTGNEGDVYFISNQVDYERDIEISFRQSDIRPELWQAIDGSIMPIENFSFENGRTNVKIHLSANGSAFIVFPTKQTLLVKQINTNQPKTELLYLKWDIYFEKNNQKLINEPLQDWSKHENPLIRYYSGSAVYKTTMKYFNLHGQYKLNLGKVCNLATVKVNGMDCGTVWTAPYEVDITNALQEGDNTIEISVTNTWANAINGWDKGTPPYEGIWTDGQYRMKGDKLLESGLLGPLKIVQKMK